MQLEPVDVEERLARMADGFKAALDRFDVARVVVAEGGGHLARAEIEVALACGVDDLDALGALDDRPVLEPGHVGAARCRNHPLVRNRLRRLGVHHFPPLILWTACKRCRNIVKCKLSTI